jgi:hypothetical protein
MTAKLFTAPLFPVLAALCLIAAPAAANADTIFTFSCGAGISATSSSGGASICTSTTKNGVVTYHDPTAGKPVYSWSVDNFTLTSNTLTGDGQVSGWQYATANGNPAPGLKTGFAISGVTSNTMTLTDSGGWFVFDGVDLKSSAKPTTANPMPYSVIGYMDGVMEFDITGNLSTTFTTTADSDLAIDELVLTLNDSKGTDYFDTLSITAVDAPEPTSLLLLGSGLLALSGMVRRKIRS